MVRLTIILASLLLPTIWSYNEETFPHHQLNNPDGRYPAEISDDLDVDIRRRNNNNFLRFGRNGYDVDDYEDEESDDFARPTRSGNAEKNNDYFIRFGRIKPDFLRFGQTGMRDKSGYHQQRFKRSLDVIEKNRNKRETEGTSNGLFKKNDSNFMRFGRNSNFLRFGRAERFLEETKDSHLIRLMKEFLDCLKNEKCNNIV